MKPMRRSKIGIRNKMAPYSKSARALLLQRMLLANRKRKEMFQKVILMMQAIKVRMLVLLICILAFAGAGGLGLGLGLRERSRRKIRRLSRNTDWWNKVSQDYSDQRFKKIFRVSKGTFKYILDTIKNDISKETVTEEPISPEKRLSICLLRLGRGDYNHTISELVGVGESTVCNVTEEVCKALVTNLWHQYVTQLFPNNNEKMMEMIVEMDSEWQFPYSFCAVDGCHLPMRCPRGGAEARKEHHNFKNFYSLILMALVDAKYRFIWAGSGWAGNTHDSTVFQSTKLYRKILHEKLIPDIRFSLNDLNIGPIILGDGAFPLQAWLQKPYSNATLTKEQKYFNYRLSRARMVVESAFGMLKGRWRVLLRKCEASKDTVKLYSLACVVLHNLCLQRGDTVPRSWDLKLDDIGNHRRPTEKVRELLVMVQGNNQQRGPGAERVREAIKIKLWNEKETQIVT